MLYEYRARLLRVVDSDTVNLNVDLGFDTHLHSRFRLKGINAPEKNSPVQSIRVAAYDAMHYLEGLLIGWLLVKTYKDKEDKYGRWLCEIYKYDSSVSDRNFAMSINGEMIKAGHAVPYDGGKREL